MKLFKKECNGQVLLIIVLGIILIAAVLMNYMLINNATKNIEPIDSVPVDRIDSQEEKANSLSYNQVLGSKAELSSIPEVYSSKYDGATITWQAKISGYYTQITGIKFCVVDNDHINIDINKPCDWFWATSKDSMNADNTKVNPEWDGKWVNYILKYYRVPFDENENYYNEVYVVTGKINGLDCGVDGTCRPDIEIIGITKR